MESIDFSISNEYEENIVGIIEYSNGACFPHYSEESMLRAYKEKGFEDIIDIKEYVIFPDEEKHRHGLQYEIIKEQYNKLGLEYLKLDYMRDYVYESNNKDDNDLFMEFVR